MATTTHSPRVTQLRGRSAPEPATTRPRNASYEHTVTRTRGDIRIERGIAMPDFSVHAAKYPWRDLQVGESFVAMGRRQATFSSYCRDKSKRLGMVFRSQELPDGSGVRVWRVK